MLVLEGKTQAREAGRGRTSGGQLAQEFAFAPHRFELLRATQQATLRHDFQGEALSRVTSCRILHLGVRSLAEDPGDVEECWREGSAQGGGRSGGGGWGRHM